MCIIADRIDCVRVMVRVEDREWVDELPVPASPRRGNSESNRPMFATDHFSDATDLTALPFDQLPTTFSIALPFLHRPLIVGVDVATSVTPPWARHREKEREGENESGKRDRAPKMEGRLYGAVRKEAREESLCLMSLRRGELLATYASPYVATRGSERVRKYFP